MEYILKETVEQQAIAYLETSRNIHERNVKRSIVFNMLRERYPITKDDLIPVTNTFNGKKMKEGIPRAIGMMTYIQLNSKKPSSKLEVNEFQRHLGTCPVCQKSSIMQNLIV